MDEMKPYVDMFRSGMVLSILGQRYGQLVIAVQDRRSSQWGGE